MTSAHAELDRRQGELERRLKGKTFDERVAELQGIVEGELASPPAVSRIIDSWGDLALFILGVGAGGAVVALVTALW